MVGNAEIVLTNTLLMSGRQGDFCREICDEDICPAHFDRYPSWGEWEAADSERHDPA